MDAHARAELARRRSDVPWNVDRDDGAHDAAVSSSHAAALSAGCCHDARAAEEWADHTRGGELLLRLTVAGIAIYPLGVALTTIEMREPALARAVPVAVGVVVIVCGALQFSAWKLRHLSCCREAPAPDRTLTACAAAAWQYGLHLGVHCAQCCAGLVVILLAVGMMDLRAMVAVTVLITLERLAPKGQHVARTLGAVIVLAGVLLIVRAAGGI